jgi:hypothetical protein
VHTYFSAVETMKAIVKCKPVEKLSVLDEILTEKITQKSQAQVFRLNIHLRFHYCKTHRVHIFTRDATGLVYLPTQMDRTLHLTGDGKCSEIGWASTQPSSPAWANITLMIECTPERDCCYSVYSVISHPPPLLPTHRTNNSQKSTYHTIETINMQKSKKTLDFTILWLLFDFLSLKTDIYSKKTLKKTYFLLASFFHWRKSRTRILKNPDQ